MSGNVGPAVISLEVAIRLCSKIGRKDTENPMNKIRIHSPLLLT